MPTLIEPPLARVHRPGLPEKDIIRIVDAHDIPWRLEWGKNGWRTMQDFVRYMREDQFVFRDPHLKPLTVDVYPAVVKVFHQEDGQMWELFEAYQKNLRTGIPKSRADTFDGIAETMKKGRTPREGALDCLSEELGFKDESRFNLSGLLEIRQMPEDPLPPQDSEKWPHIKVVFHRHIFTCYISRALFKKGEGYVEIDDEWEIHFQWKRFIPADV